MNDRASPLENPGKGQRGMGGSSVPGVPDRFKHYCHYVLIKKTIKDRINGQHWNERCRCGRYKSVDYTFNVDGSNSPRMKITWFDRNGNVTEVTGGV